MGHYPHGEELSRRLLVMLISYAILSAAVALLHIPFASAAKNVDVFVQASCSVEDCSGSRARAMDQAMHLRHALSESDQELGSGNR